MQNPNPSEIVALIASHQPRLRGFVRCLLVRVSDVEDVLQEINAVLWEKASDYRSGTDFWAWASQIARFKILNYLRNSNRNRIVFDDSLLNDLADIAHDRLARIDYRREALESCLNKLPPPQRQLIDLRYSSGQAIDSIAEMIGRPQASIRQTLYRVRQTLLACIESKLKSEGL